MASSFFPKVEDPNAHNSNIIGFRSRKPGHDGVLNGSSTRLTSGGGGGLAAKKKLTIKPFKVTPKLPDAFEEETWKKLEAAINAVHQKQTTTLSREELYRSVEDMCTWKMAARYANVYRLWLWCGLCVACSCVVYVVYLLS